MKRNQKRFLKQQEPVEAKADAEEVTEEVEEKDDEEEELEARDPNESIPMINLLSADQDKLQHGDLVNYNEKMFRVTKIATGQSPIFKFLEVDADGQDCDNVLNVKADDISQVEKIETKASEDEGSEDQSQELHIKSTKEKDMAEQVVDTPIVLDTGASEKKAVKRSKKKLLQLAEVSEPQVAELVEKTGEAIMAEAEAADQQVLVKETHAVAYTSRESEQVAELQSQMNKYQEEIAAFNVLKCNIKRIRVLTSQFSEKDMANAVLVAKMLNKRDVFDTKMGQSMKAVTTVDQFLSNFSSNIYTEMEQQLVVAPLFNRIAVDAKTFSVPVADEDTDGDVAQFASGTFATGIADATRVPTSNQNTIASVDFTPHKFMATTHLQKTKKKTQFFLARLLTCSSNTSS